MTETSPAPISIKELESGLFDPDAARPFHLVAGDISLPVTLMECKERPDSAGPDCVRTPFSLVFRAELDEAHPMQNALEFHGDIHGLDEGGVPGLLIHRILRPVKMPEGAYYQVIFN